MARTITSARIDDRPVYYENVNGRLVVQLGSGRVSEEVSGDSLKDLQENVRMAEKNRAQARAEDRAARAARKAQVPLEERDGYRFYSMTYSSVRHGSTSVLQATPISYRGRGANGRFLVTGLDTGVKQQLPDCPAAFTDAEKTAWDIAQADRTAATERLRALTARFDTGREKLYARTSMSDVGATEIILRHRGSIPEFVTVSVLSDPIVARFSVGIESDADSVVFTVVDEARDLSVSGDSVDAVAHAILAHMHPARGTTVLVAFPPEGYRIIHREPEFDGAVDKLFRKIEALHPEHRLYTYSSVLLVDETFDEASARREYAAVQSTGAKVVLLLEEARERFRTLVE